MANYDKDTDYQALINQAAAAGNMQAAAQYEQMRNDKIIGEGLNYDTTSKYINQPSQQSAPSTPSYASMPDNYGGSSTSVGVNSMTQKQMQDQMNQNSIAWYSADDAEKARLHAENERLAQLLGGSVNYNSASGYWGGSAQQQPFTYSDAPAYVSQYQGLIDEWYSKILGRDPFSYDYMNDPLYAQYKDTYTREGQRAMQDTLGQVSARTGGLASSYAASAAQQANDYYMSRLSDKIPELQQLAYSMYMDEGNTQRMNLDMLMALEQGDYNKYLTLLNQYNTDRSFDYGVYSDDRGYMYQTGRDSINDSRYDSEWDYSVSQNAKKDAQNRIDTMLAGGASASAIPQDLVKAAGYSVAEMQAIQNYYANQAKAKSGGGGSSGYDGFDADTPIAKFMGGDHSDAIIEQLMNMGYSREELEDGGYTGDYFKNNGSTLESAWNKWESGDRSAPTKSQILSGYSDLLSIEKYALERLLNDEAIDSDLMLLRAKGIING